jgi:hypothetical protein
MNATEMKTHLQAFSKTLNNKKKDEWWGTEKDIWRDLSSKFLSWYNSHHNKVKAKEHKKNKTLEVTLSTEEADLIIQLLDQSIKVGISPNAFVLSGEKRRDVIARIQLTPTYLMSVT